jgi:hypothetical protein
VRWLGLPVVEPAGQGGLAPYSGGSPSPGEVKKTWNANVTARKGCQRTQPFISLAATQKPVVRMANLCVVSSHTVNTAILIP